MTRPVVAALLLSTLGACAANPSPEPDAARPPESAAGRDAEPATPPRSKSGDHDG